MRCSYAACDLPATAEVDSYAFCEGHARLHEDERVGAPVRDIPAWVPRPTVSAAVCATDGGYTKHRRDRTPVCEPCRVAHNARTNEYKQAVRARQRARAQAHDDVDREQQEQAVRALRARGLNDQQIAVHLKVSGRTVLRIRKRIGLVAVAA
jgi:DNA-binding CsgD family transcriptional regulator